MDEISDSLRINISEPFLEQNNFEKGISFKISKIIIIIKNINIYFNLFNINNYSPNFKAHSFLEIVLFQKRLRNINPQRIRYIIHDNNVRHNRSR